MFNTVSNSVNLALNSNDSVEKKKLFNDHVVSLLVAVVVVVVLHFVLGPYLWNNVLTRLVPAVKPARWYDTFLLSLLLSLLLVK
jgi:hypothetical protein